VQEARQLAQNGRWDRADKLLDETVRATPENVTARNLLAFSAAQRGDLDEAERQYVASLTHQPRQQRVYGALGAIALRRGDLDAAERRFHQALELAPTYVEAMSNLGFIEAIRDHGDAAQAWYERAIAVDPAYPHVYRRLADLYYDRKDYTRALDYYRKVLASLPRYFEVLIQAGNSSRFLGDADGAAAYYADAARVRNDSWIPPYNLACLRAVTGDPEAALALLGQAVDRGFGVPRMLDENDDFAPLRAQSGWNALAVRVQTAAASRPKPE
jgi:Flp pilus assembly protein TadD